MFETLIHDDEKYNLIGRLYHSLPFLHISSHSWKIWGGLSSPALAAEIEFCTLLT